MAAKTPLRYRKNSITFDIKENGEIASKMIEAVRLGKQFGLKPRKAISEQTAYKYKIWLAHLDKWFNKPFSQLNDADIDKFRRELLEDKIRRNNGKPFNPSTKADIEKKFLKPLLQFIGKTELSLFSSGYKENVDIKAISKEENERIVSRSKLREKVIFQLLFDGGFRADEFLNLRFCDVKDDALKSDGYYKIWINKSKTLKRMVGLTLPLSTDILGEWLREHHRDIGTERPLVPISYRHLALNVRRMGESVLKKKLNPHQLRHSSATYYCTKLSRYQLCKRYGWAMSSDMPQRYIDREGVEDEQINKKVVEQETLSFRKEINKLQEQLNAKTEAEKEREKQFKEMQDKMARFEKAMLVLEKLKK